MPAADCTVEDCLIIWLPANCVSFSTCPNTDINCDNITNVLDLAIVQSSANFGLGICDGADLFADVNRDGVANALDLAEVQSSACFGQ